MGKKNRIELLKEELHPFDPEFRERMERYFEEGDHTKIPPDDLERLKWYGIFYRKATPGTFMIRIRVPGGHLTAEQAKRVATLALRYAKGLVEITSRQQFQIRYVQLKDIKPILEGLAEVGITTLQTGIDNVRNIVQDPLTGLAQDSLIDTLPFVEAMNDAILGKKEYANLPRKFNPAILGSRRDTINALFNDFVLYPAEREGKLGFNLYLGGKVGSGGPVSAFDVNVFVPAEVERVVNLFLAVIRLYTEKGYRDNRNKNRLYFLIRDLGVEEFRKLLEGELGESLPTKGWDLVESYGEREGLVLQKFREESGSLSRLLAFLGLKKGLYSVLAAVPAGKLPAEDLLRFAELSEIYGDGTLRLTIYQNLYLVNVPEEKVGKLLEEEAIKRYPSAGNNIFFTHLIACAGSDTCHFGVIKNKSDAVRVAKYLTERFIPEAMVGAYIKKHNLEPEYHELAKLREKFTLSKPIRMHWSACNKGCGSHGSADVGFVGTKMRLDGEVVEAVEVFLGGSHHREGKPVGKVPLEGLEKRLEDLLWFFFENRKPNEDFFTFVHRMGVESFKTFFS